MSRAICGCRSKLSRSSARPVAKCSWARTAQRKSLARMKAATSRRSNISSLSASSGLSSGCRYWAIQKRVFRSRRPPVALLELGGDELGPGPLDHLLAEAALQRRGQRLIAGEAPRLQDGGADRMVGAGELETLLDGPRRVADFEAQVPERVEHVLDHALGVCGLLVGAQEQEIDVGEGRERAAPIAAHRHQPEALAFGRIAGA